MATQYRAAVVRKGTRSGKTTASATPSHGARSAGGASRIGDDVSEGGWRGGGSASLQVSPGVAKESLSNGPLSADSNQGPPPVRPRVLRASAEEGWGLAGFEGRQLPHQTHGIIAPSAVDLTSQDDKGSVCF